MLSQSSKKLAEGKQVTVDSQDTGNFLIDNPQKKKTSQSFKINKLISLLLQKHS